MQKQRKSNPKRNPANRSAAALNVAALLVAGLLTVITAASCVPKPQEGESGQQVLNFAVASNIKGLDPALADDLYTNIVVKEVYDALFQYNYLKRPVELEPAMAKAMPKVSKDGLVYEIELKPGLLFVDDPCFTDNQSKGREIVAKDFVYSIKRIADAKINSTGWWLFSDRIRGLDEFYDKSKDDQPTNYEADVKGLTAPSKYQIRIELIKPYPQLLWALAMSYGSVVPHEAVKHYGEEFINHPVGSGPFKFVSWRRGLRVELERNPTYREEYYPTEADPDDEKAGLLADKGKRLPFADKVVLHIFRESQPLWLNFMRGSLDGAGIPKDNFDDSIDKEGNLKPELKNNGIILWKYASPDVTYTIFNMNDPILGKNLELRQAISLAYSAQKRIDLLYNGRAISAQGPIPPDLAGYDPQFKNPLKAYDPDKAKLLLAKAGYPNGKGLPILEYETVASTTSRQFDELFKREMEAIGVRIKFNSNTWPEMTEKLNQGKAQLSSIAWHADYPDAENFLALFYGPNKAPGVNSSNYQNKEFDQLFDKIRTMPDSPQRTEIYKKMVQIVTRDAPWIFGVHRLAYALQHGWLKNYKPHPISRGMLKYLRVDNDEKAKLIRKF